jgi:hypothetical protein
MMFIRLLKLRRTLMKLKLNRAASLVELLVLTSTIALLAGCSDPDVDAPVPRPPVAAAADASNVVAQAPAVVAPPLVVGLAFTAAPTVAPTNSGSAPAVAETPLYNLTVEDIQKHPKWGPVLQQLSQSCVAFFAAQKRVPGSVDEMKAKGFVKDFPAAPEGMMYQVDGANYRVLLVSM